MGSEIPKIKKTRLLTAEFFTGLLCLGALAILFYFTVVIRGKDVLFQSKKYSISAEFPNAGALAVNDKVKVIGVDMGVVKSIDLAPDCNSIIVHLQLNRPVQINEDYEISIQNQSVFGGAYVNIIPGIHTNSPVPPDRMLSGKPPIDIILEASTLIAALKEDEKKIRETLLDSKFFDDVKQAIQSLESNSRNFNRISEDILAGKGTIGKLFQDSELYDTVRNTFNNISATTTELNKLLQSVQDGKGTLGKLLKEDTAYNSMMEAMNSTDALLKKLSGSDGSLARFLNDNGKLYDSLDSALKNMDHFTQDLKDGKGTLGKIMSDEELYIEIKDTVRQLRAAIEDFREMAPVATFGSVALGAL